MAEQKAKPKKRRLAAALAAVTLAVAPGAAHADRAPRPGDRDRCDSGRVEHVSVPTRVVRPVAVPTRVVVPVAVPTRVVVPVAVPTRVVRPVAVPTRVVVPVAVPTRVGYGMPVHGGRSGKSSSIMVEGDPLAVAGTVVDALGSAAEGDIKGIGEALKQGAGVLNIFWSKNTTKGKRGR